MHGGNPVGGIIWGLVLFTIYFLPWFIAMLRKHPQVAPIFIINLFLGWTLIGWVIVLAWSAGTIKNDVLIGIVKTEKDEE